MNAPARHNKKGSTQCSLSCIAVIESKLRTPELFDCHGTALKATVCCPLLNTSKISPIPQVYIFYDDYAHHQSLQQNKYASSRAKVKILTICLYLQRVYDI